MTLSPVFRSPRAVRLLREEGIWDRLTPDIAGQARAVETLQGELRRLIDPRFLRGSGSLPRDGAARGPEAMSFLQEYFFLILFRSIFRALGVGRGRLELYAELNFCIKGTITAADNLFDDQAKRLLPLRDGRGARYLSILQLMCFERLLRIACDRAAERGVLTGRDQTRCIQGELLTRMAEIGALEGSEEGGVEEVPPPGEMVERVHRVRGGALFALAFVAPRILESGPIAGKLSDARPAVARLGTAFQIVDDLTDFEFDLSRRRHNLLVSQVRHHAGTEERSALEKLRTGEVEDPSGMVEGVFRESARAVLERAYGEARSGFARLAELGFWFPPELADEVVHAIVGLEGVPRMESLAAGD